MTKKIHAINKDKCMKFKNFGKKEKEKLSIGSGTLLSPLPVIVLSCGEYDKTNLITLAWTGIINTKPPMLSFSIRPERYSYTLLQEKKQVVVNLVDRALTKATDFCGVKSGRQVDKFSAMSLTKQKLHANYPAAIEESPVQLLCTVVDKHELGTHTCFFAEIDDVFVRLDLLNEQGAVELAKLDFVTYSHGNYYQIGDWLGFFGYSVAGAEKFIERKQKMQKCAPWHFPQKEEQGTKTKRMKPSSYKRRKAEDYR